MATNLYFNNYPAGQITSEQLLVEDLVIEAMQMYGMDVYYMPRSNANEDDYLFGDSQLKEYRNAYALEMYLENVMGMEGEGDFISKFGLEIRDEMTFVVSRRRFKYAARASNLNRPREGDLIYVPLVQNFFEITFVEHENDQAMMHTFGRGRGGNVFVYVLKLKQFVFSNEVVDTGVTQVDEQMRDHYTRTRITLSSGSGSYLADEIVYQGADLANATAQAVVFDATYAAGNNILTIIRPIGNFITGPVKGVTSNAVWNANVVSEMAEMQNPFEDIFDNKQIEDEGTDILDWTEKNPFGEA